MVQQTPIKDNSINNLELWFFLINQLIPVAGLVFLHWGAFSIFYVFFIDLLFYGAIQLLKILTAMKGMQHWYSMIVPRLGLALFYVVMFVSLYMIVFAWVLSSMDIKTAFNNIEGINLTFWIMIINYGYYFLFGHIASGRYKTTDIYSPAVTTLVRLMPMAMLLLFLVLPQAKNFKGYNINIYVLCGIIIVRMLVDFVIMRISGKKKDIG